MEEVEVVQGEDGAEDLLDEARNACLLGDLLEDNRPFPIDNSGKFRPRTKNEILSGLTWLEALQSEMQNRTTLLTAMALTIVTGCGGATESQIPSSGDSDAAAQDSGGSSSDAGSSSGGDSATATTDATTTTQGEPTWTYLVNTYLSGGKVGNCTRCHSQFSTPPKAYTYLSGKGYIKGASSPLVSTSQSCLSWYSGTMPPGGPTSVPAAVTDFNAWAAAGAKND